MGEGLFKELPLGLVELDEAGTILYYHGDSDTASGCVAEGFVGRNFFTDFAPIADAAGFRSKVDAFRRAHAASYGFDYCFAGAADGGNVKVLLARVREADGSGRETFIVQISANREP